MTETVTHVDGCEHCGDRAAVSPEHVTECAELHAHRRAARQHADRFGIPPASVDDLFAHLSTPRVGGPFCTAEHAVSVVYYVAALGWRPVVGRRTRHESGVETREPQGDFL